MLAALDMPLRRPGRPRERVGQIAADLGVALSTTRNHLKASFKKLGVKSQADLVALVLGGSGGPR